MTRDTITQLPDPQGFSPDPLTDLLRSGAQRLIEQAVEAELAALLETYADDRTDDGRARLVRHGHLPEREVITAVGAVRVKVLRLRDRSDAAEKVRFTSTTLPPHLRKAKSIEELLPWGPASHRQNQRLPQPQNGPRHGVQTDDLSPNKMAHTGRSEPYAGDHPGD